MVKLKYTGESWTQAGPEGLLVTPGQEVNLRLDDQEVAELLATGAWELLDGRRPDREIQIFISHSSRDAELAKAIISLLEQALPLPRRVIRCTSVDGYRLRAGASIDETLRAEVHDAALVLALLTPSAMESTYVMFEIGARWGSRKPLIPLLASGLTPQELKPPLSGIYAINCADRPQVTRLVPEVAECLGIRPKDVPVEAAIDEVAQMSLQANIDRALSTLAQRMGEAALGDGRPER